MYLTWYLSPKITCVPFFYLCAAKCVVRGRSIGPGTNDVNEGAFPRPRLTNDHHVLRHITLKRYQYHQDHQLVKGDLNTEQGFQNFAKSRNPVEGIWWRQKEWSVVSPFGWWNDIGINTCIWAEALEESIPCCHSVAKCHEAVLQLSSTLTQPGPSPDEVESRPNLCLDSAAKLTLSPAQSKWLSSLYYVIFWDDWCCLSFGPDLRVFKLDHLNGYMTTSLSENHCILDICGM
jgi:hypothetical protein